MIQQLRRDQKPDVFLQNEAHVEKLSQQYGINEEDVLLIALNACGVKSSLPYPRMRFQFRLHTRPDDPIYLILALGRETSPFELTAERILFYGEETGQVEHLDNDDAVIGYFRKGGRAMTLNSNARSQCTGCVFCPNTLETSTDPRLKQLDDLKDYFGFLVQDLGWEDLSDVEKITVCTGCFHYENLAIDHLAMVREAASYYNFTGQIHLLSSVVRTPTAFERIRREVGWFHLTLTIECFTNREVILKKTKADFRFEDMLTTLQGAKEAGFDTDYTYIVGLDNPNAALPKIWQLRDYVTTFPKFQIYQAHNSFMQFYMYPEANSIDFFLRMRQSLEEVFVSTNLRPQSWENYRSPWYFTFAGKEHRTIRI
jgi:hypothetical protein